MDIEQYLIDAFLEKRPEFSFTGEKPGDDFTAEAESDPCLKSLALFYLLRNAETRLKETENNRSAAQETLDQETSRSKELQARLSHYRAEYNDLKQLSFDHKVNQKLDDRHKKIRQIGKEIENIDISGIKATIANAEEEIQSCRKEIAEICRSAVRTIEDPAVITFFKKACPATGERSRKGDMSGSPADLSDDHVSTKPRAESEALSEHCESKRFGISDLVLGISNLRLAPCPLTNNIIGSVYNALKSEKSRRDREQEEGQRKAQEHEAVLAAHKKYVRKEKKEKIKGKLKETGKKCVKWGAGAALITGIVSGSVYLLHEYRPREEPVKKPSQARKNIRPVMPRPVPRTQVQLKDIGKTAKYAISKMKPERTIIQILKINEKPESLRCVPETGDIVFKTSLAEYPQKKRPFKLEGKDGPEIAVWARYPDGHELGIYYSIDPATGKGKELARNRITRSFGPDYEFKWKKPRWTYGYKPDPDNPVDEHGNMHMVDIKTSQPYGVPALSKPYRKPGEEFDNIPDLWLHFTPIDISLSERKFRVLKSINVKEFVP